MAERELLIPVIIGVGQVNDRPLDPAHGLDSLGLMEAALRAADADAKGGWLSQLDSLAVVAQISFWHLGDVSGPLAERLGAKARVCYQTATPSGDSPILLLNEAANRIAAGEIEIAAVVGGEALRTKAQRAAATAHDSQSNHNLTREVLERPASYRQRYGLTTPVDIYPLYENALRAAYGQTLADGQRETGEIWSRLSQIAAQNPGAWITSPKSVEEIIRPSSDNRPIAFPYNKFMVANSSVNQGAGFIVTSLGRAMASGLKEDDIIYIGRGAAAHEPEDFLARDRYDYSSSMAVTLQRTLELNGLSASDIDFVELYSCFPCVPKMARRLIDWPLDKPATVFGGLTFGGGPIGNYMSHAVVSMVETLRRNGRTGLLFGNGGIATHNHAIILSSDRLETGILPHDFDFQADADAARGAVPSHMRNYVGPGVIETYTVLYDRDGCPKFGVIIGRNPNGARFLAKVLRTSTADIAFLVDGASEPIGTPGYAVEGADGDILWVR